ncbi:hypothetical protein SPRG_00390 [Saprolegnia parasitica CBS 223.65]|uniref:Uncharacterized protein n=1 Tax=Saprolegnia parasitica (strain CBS 223.65) TaxID=695850 RepID=A0A067CXW1_SAPPC|nr:hypothetical protein SPRG_00390 [Saprolegnia parasitica CBS 223.65]KDO35544.1 hypothetical protein SPRG_00390 [Saprolegnia parasitica CBS 223.65]|eukprot:XP_012193879.1 hypothetical protein SPRG_00390 [Saprolegnia parasitica CBS 223.65]
MGQCCSKKHVTDVDDDVKHVVRSPAPALQISPSDPVGYAGLATTTAEPAESVVLSSTAEIVHDNNSPSGSPAKPEKQPNDPTLEETPDEPKQQQQQQQYVRPEDRPIESLFIREERKRLARIQEDLRLEREAANAKWVQELAEKKREFYPTPRRHRP